MTFGCILGGLLMEKFGRRPAQFLSTFPCLIGYLIIFMSHNIPTILVGRFLTGLCGGLLGPNTGVYISETSEPRYRGFLLSGLSLAVALGLFLVHLLGTLLDWRTTALISSILPVISFTLLCFIPESPSWLAKTGSTNKAKAAFFWCRGHSEEAKAQLAIIMEKAQTNETESMGRQLKSLCEPEFVKPLSIIVVFIVSNQWAGVNALTFYTIFILRSLLGEELDEYVAMLIVDIIRIVMSVIACIVIRKIGRRPLALISTIGTSTSLFALSLYTFLTQNFLDNYLHYTIIFPMISLIAYISFISIGFVPLPWAMMGEVFPLKSRNIGASISSLMAFGAFFSVVKSSPYMFDSLGTDGTFAVYGFVAFLAAIFIFICLPETKDKQLQEIEDRFRNKEKNNTKNKI